MNEPQVEEQKSAPEKGAEERISTQEKKPAEQESVDPDFAAAIADDLNDAEKSESGERPRIAATGSTGKVFNPDIFFILTTGLGGYIGGHPFPEGGHAVDENGFALQGLEFGASAAIDPYFRFDLHFELAHLHLEEAYLTTLALPGNLQARAGYFNAKFGRQNPLHLHAWSFVSPPLSQTRFMDSEAFSGPGMEWSVLLPLPWYSMVLVEMMSTSTKTGFRSSTFANVEMNKSGKTDGFDDFVYVGRLENFVEISSDWSLLLGGSTALGQSPYVPDNRSSLFGGDMTVKWRPSNRGGEVWFKLTVEGILRQTQIPKDSAQDWGGYAQLDVQMARQWMMGLRGDYADLLNKTEAVTGIFGGRETRGALSLTFAPTHFSKIRLQGDVLSSETSSELSYGGFLQVEVSAGAHTAHGF